MKNSFIVSSRILAIAAAVLLCLAAQAPASAATTERVSVASDGTQANAGSNWPWISGDGSCVAFESAASTLVSGDTNAKTDIFVHNRLTHTTECVSVAWGGAQANGNSQLPCISDDGLYVAFHSYATNLVPNDTNNWFDAFLHDRATGVTEIVSVSSDDLLGNRISGEARVSAHGRFVVFTSVATNLVPVDPNSYSNVFLRDRLLGTTELVSVSTSGAPGNYASGRPFVSADGRFVTFYSDASNLVSGDTNGWRDVFVRDRLLGTTERVSVSSSGTQGNLWSGDPSISADGRFVAFQSYASNLVPGDTNGGRDVFVRDRLLGTTECMSVSNVGVPGGGSHFGMISGDGRFVSFYSTASNLVPGDTNGRYDIFVRDRQTLTTERFSLSSSGAQANDHSSYPHISADGQFVTYKSAASNLVGGDTNGYADVFVRDMTPPGNTPVGTDVMVELDAGVKVTFAEVTKAGDTKVEVKEIPPAPLYEFKVLEEKYYDIKTSAEYDPPVLVKKSYDPAHVPGGQKNEHKLKMKKYKPAEEKWLDVTKEVDLVKQEVKGESDGLSYFAVGLPLYQFHGFLPPVEGRTKPFKRASTIPIKFRISDQLGAPVTDAVCTLAIYYLESGAPAGDAEVVSTAAGDWGNQFRYDPEGDLYIFNLSTKDASFLGYFTYRVEVTLDDGETYGVDFALK